MTRRYSTPAPAPPPGRRRAPDRWPCCLVCSRPRGPRFGVFDQEFINSRGGYAYGGDPDIDDLFPQQARERDPRRREALLHRIQQLTIERVMFAPLIDLRVLMGVGPKVVDHTITSIAMSPFPSYEDMKLRE